MMLNKRGQAAAGAALLLGVVAVLLVGFLILIPPQERTDLLDDTQTDTGTDNTVSGNLLLKESPGKVDYLTETEMDHPLPTVNIYTKTEARVLSEKNQVYAKKGVFSEKIGNLKFSVSDLTNTEGYILNFKVTSITGKLIITLNGEELFNSEIANNFVRPINLPKNLILAENELIFESSSPGLAFWSTNEVLLENVKVVAEVTSLEAQSSKNVFLVSDVEFRNLNKITLRFQPSCQQTEVGRLIIKVNNQEIYSGLPECDTNWLPVEFSLDLINQGENEIVFYTEKGTYSLNHVEINSQLKELEYPTYYFEISQEEYDLIQNDELRVRITLDFVDIVTEKFGDLILNGRIKHFDTKELTYTLDVSNDIVLGNNALKIRPQKTIDIRQLKAELIEN